METIEKVLKENISGLKFIPKEVLSSHFAIQEREEKLTRAMQLGNNYHGKVKITFETLEGVKEVETTIWSITDKNVLLKAEIAIPIHCIKDVWIY